jgi:hypothetical protein
MAAVRFIPGPDQGDADTVVLAVELHEEVVVIDIATTLVRAIQHFTVRHVLPSVRVEDDLGTEYRGESLDRYGGGWSDIAPAAHYPFEVRPAVPPEARFLRITFASMYAENRTVVVML